MSDLDPELVAAIDGDQDDFDYLNAEVADLRAQLTAERAVRENVERQFGELTGEHLKLLDIVAAERAAREKAEAALQVAAEEVIATRARAERAESLCAIRWNMYLNADASAENYRMLAAKAEAERDALRARAEKAEAELARADHQRMWTEEVVHTAGLSIDDGLHESVCVLIAERDALREKLEATEAYVSSVQEERDAWIKTNHQHRVERDAAIARVATIRREALAEAAAFVASYDERGLFPAGPAANDFIAKSIARHMLRALAPTEGEKTE